MLRGFVPVIRRSFGSVLILGLFCSVDASIAAPGIPERYALADLKALQEAFVQLAESVGPSVVVIRTYKVAPLGDAADSRVRVPLSQGSGFVLESDGYVVTNRHVVEDADLVSVRLSNGLAYDAVFIQSDPRSDLAVLKIDAADLKAIRFGDATKIKVNQWVFACGNPFGLANDNGRSSVTYGVISALGRQMTQRLVGNSAVEYYGNLLETSALISPGNSGGPLFNVDGEMVGVVTAIETGSGGPNHGFAIPMDKNIRRILATLRAGQQVRYGFLGVQVGEVEPPSGERVADAPVSLGALIREIQIADGPAAVAGLRPRDIVLEFDGVAVQDSDHLVRLVGFTPVGTEAPVTYLRGGIKRRTTVTVGDRAALLGIQD